jgi:hypothetical protein
MSSLHDTRASGALSHVRSPVLAIATRAGLIEVMARSPGLGKTSLTSEWEESCVSRRIAGVLGVVSRFIPRSSLSGKSRDRKKHSLGIERDRTTSDPPAKRAPADDCDGLFGIGDLLLQDERTELEKLIEEIDQFSQTFKSAERKQCNV